MIHAAQITAFLLLPLSQAFIPTTSTKTTLHPYPLLHATTTSTSSETKNDDKRLKTKQSLLNLIGAPSTSYTDPTLACPITKYPLRVTMTPDPIISSSRKGTKRLFSTNTTSYEGRSDTFYDFLPSEKNDAREEITNSLRAFLPPPLRAVLSSDYIPMRDLFTSPAVSFAYERGWRQQFAAAGFPGIEKEYEMVREYFLPVTVGRGESVVVDMSCATGLMTRRLASSNDYNRVLGCDYSPAMLTEARRRIRSSPGNPALNGIELVRCDVAQIPMLTESVNALHAGAAMHCWPDVEAGLSEIYRVLKKDGRYFGSTFLSQYFQGVQKTEGNVAPSQMAFQYFTSADDIKKMCIRAGFEESKVNVEVLGRACIIVRCEK